MKKNKSETKSSPQSKESVSTTGQNNEATEKSTKKLFDKNKSYWIISHQEQKPGIPRKMIYLGGGNTLDNYDAWDDPKTKWKLYHAENDNYWIVSDSNQTLKNKMIYIGASNTIDNTDFWEQASAQWRIIPVDNEDNTFWIVSSGDKMIYVSDSNTIDNYNFWEDSAAKWQIIEEFKDN